MCQCDNFNKEPTNVKTKPIIEIDNITFLGINKGCVFNGLSSQKLIKSIALSYITRVIPFHKPFYTLL